MIVKGTNDREDLLEFLKKTDQRDYGRITEKQPVHLKIG
jgi:hypothetical protein